MSVFAVYPNESSNKVCQILGTTSVKRRDTGEYENDFSAFCSCVGEAVTKKALALKPSKTKPVKIRILDSEVKHTFKGTGADRKVEYINYNIYDFDFGDDEVANQTMKEVDTNPAYEGLSDDPDDEGLPF